MYCNENFWSFRTWKTLYEYDGQTCTVNYVSKFLKLNWLEKWSKKEKEKKKEKKQLENIKW